MTSFEGDSHSVSNGSRLQGSQEKSPWKVVSLDLEEAGASSFREVLRVEKLASPSAHVPSGNTTSTMTLVEVLRL